MYNVLLVDDEPWVLKGINESFKWEEEGFRVIAHTTHALEAFDIILKEKPDVVFTDIRMPKVSGLELIQRVRELGLDTEFIIISGFSEFSYAQEALQQGAFDYCLKPLELDYANKLLVKLRLHLETKKKSRDFELLDALFENKANTKEILHNYGLKSCYKYYQAAVVIFQDDVEDNIFSILSKEINYLKVITGQNKHLYIINSDIDINKKLDGVNSKGLYLGLSSKAGSPDGISALCKEADVAAGSYFIYNEFKLYEYKKKNISSINSLTEKLFFHIEKNSIDELKTIIDSIPDYFRTHGLHMDDLIYFYNQIVAFVTKNYAESPISRNFEFMDYEQLFSRFQDIKSFCEYLLIELTSFDEKANDFYQINEKMNVDFNKLLKYIQKNYYEQFFLKELAKKYYINQNYCCYLFKKVTGSTFSDYVNKIRMEKSKELLRSMELTIDEIAQKVGYNDYFYFNKVFKRYHGSTPSKYRKNL
jgi:two-component system, response regulator YesN